ncbi:LacI family DNA-binding transcriptional regulator [Kordiimonas sp.]|uniref:LacI family DNA-binding transcriptional regulator n=1 Tax=Kordiimonas sp. TaxID=1970157 RepID=UPI003A8F199E
MKPKNATMSDVARLAGVSMKTVSRVFNNEKYVSEDKKKKILEVAEQLNFRPSLQARGLAGNKSYMVGLFVDEPSGDYISKVLRSVLNRCEDFGCHLVVEVFREQGNEAKLRQVLNSIRFDAVILSAPICDDTVVLNALRASGVPTARIAPGVEAGDMIKVSIDEFQAAFEMTEHLVNMGHEKIAFVKGDPNHSCSVDRERGYVRAMQSHGLKVKHEMIVPGMFSYASGREAAETLLALDDRPTAIFASNDEMAAGILAVAREKGVAVPEELSIAGFDDDAIATIVSPSLTTVRQPVEEMAGVAFDMVMALDKSEEQKLTSAHGFSLCIRDSVADLRAS